MELQEALRLKKVKFQEQVGYEMVPGESGRMVRKYKILEREATTEDVLAYNPEKGVIVLKDGQRIKIYDP